MKRVEYSGKRVSDGKRVHGQLFVMPDGSMYITDRFRYEFSEDKKPEKIDAISTINDHDAFLVWQDTIKVEKKIKI